MEVNTFFEKVAATLHLGDLVSEVGSVHGGLMHAMYRLETTSGSYAVKLLNPNIMKRPEAMGNYREADRLESILQKNHIPILPSLTFNGKKMQQLEGQYFYVYEWFDGAALKDKDIKKQHCHKIARVLSQIHNIEIKEETYASSPIDIDWDHYMGLAKEQNSVIYHLLNTNRVLLYESQSRGNIAIYDIPEVLSICHNDMDCKNVLWQHEDFKIIDLECLGYANPYLELYELALCWSGYEACNIDFELLGIFLNAYFGDKPRPDINWESIYYSNCGRLAWLEYNVKRALRIACDTPKEQELGMEQARKTIELMAYYYSAKDEIIDSCIAYSCPQNKQRISR